MPILTPGDLHVNRELTDIMVAYAAQTQNFIADKVFPNVPVDKQTDFYYKFGRRSFLQTQMTKRAPATETPGVDWNVTKDTFSCDVWGLHNDIEDQLRSNADANFQLDATGTELITQQTLLRRELQWVSKFWVNNLWAADSGNNAWQGAANASVTTKPVTGVGTGTTQFVQFSDGVNSDPIGVFNAIRKQFQLRTGVKPNKVVFGIDVWYSLLNHPQIVDRVKYTQLGFVTEQLIARAIGIDEVHILDAVQATNTADELVADVAPATQYVSGGPAGSPTAAGSDSMLICYAAPRATRNQPSAGYTFSWNGYAGASAFGGRVKKYRMEHIASDRIEIEAAYDMKAVAPEMGLFCTDVV